MKNTHKEWLSGRLPVHPVPSSSGAVELFFPGVPQLGVWVWVWVGHESSAIDGNTRMMWLSHDVGHILSMWRLPASHFSSMRWLHLNERLPQQHCLFNSTPQCSSSSAAITESSTTANGLRTFHIKFWCTEYQCPIGQRLPHDAPYDPESLFADF